MAKTWSGTERERVAVRDGAAALVAGIKDERDESAEKRLAGHIKNMKREALSRDGSLVLGTKPAPNAAIARIVLASLKAIRQHYVPAAEAHALRASTTYTHVMDT